MIYSEYSFRHCKAIIDANPHYHERYLEFVSVLAGITDEDLIRDFNQRKEASLARHSAFKSLSQSINHIFKSRMVQVPGWVAESDIFRDDETSQDDWRLDFACDVFSCEVAFNHSSVIAINLLKPTLASELNHVQKAIQTDLGIYVCATRALKEAGNFDNAVGEYEKVLRHLDPLRNQLTVPMMIIGLEAPETFYIDSRTRSVARI